MFAAAVHPMCAN